MIRRPNTNKVTKATTLRRPSSRRIDEDQLAAHFEGNEEEHALYRAAVAVANSAGHDEVEDAVIGDTGSESFKDDPGQEDGEGDVEAEHEPEHGHGHEHIHGHLHGHVHGHNGEADDNNDDAMDHGIPMAPMSAEPHHHHHHQPHAQTHHSQHQQAIDDILGTGSMSYAQAAAAATAADLQPPPPPQPNVGPTISAPQPLVAATDFQPTPSTSSHSASQAPPPPLPQQHHLQQQQQQQHHHPAPAPLASQQQQQEQQPQQPKTTEQMAQESGYTGFKVDSAFAKRMARDPGQRLAEQRRHGQDLNLVRRSNVEALFAQIAGSEAQHPCAHCRKGQGPWTVCVVYSGQMMGSCANCWFNASGSRCSFHEKSQPVQPAQHPYAAVPVPLPIAGDQQQQPGAGGGVGGVGGAFVVGSPSQLQAAQFWQVPALTFSSDAGVKQTVLNALTAVRTADRYQRALIEVDVAAKQLALKIVHAEELAAGVGGSVDLGVVGNGGEDDGGNDGRQDSHYESPPPGGDVPEEGDS
ncbi:hypothetical protein VPNG_00573 [Cytospora leucostoma]|uniref:Uncharacterized protein n=1 Tax=Cytospora leucostoma TaxID=1230097 RepID=A0A423XN12_9PEZI|nr:hypothetical protein VPNG_00573 [Cytospora leucostoma]